MSTTLNPGFDSYGEYLDDADVELIGVLTWYSVPSYTAVTYSQFNDAVDEFSAPMDKIKKPVPANVFRRACVASQIRKCTGEEDGVVYDYLIEDAGYSPDLVVRNVMEIKKDKKNKTRETKHIGTLSFHKETKVFQPLIPLPIDTKTREKWDSIVKSIRTILDEDMEGISDLNVRESARTALRDRLHATEVKPGAGIYIVPFIHMKKLEAIQSVINSIPAASMHITPLLDDLDQFQMVYTALEDESVEVNDEIELAIYDLGDSPTAKQVKDIEAKISKFRVKLLIYEKMLGTPLGALNTDLDASKSDLDIELSKLGT